jgi:hypothetical protein
LDRSKIFSGAVARKVPGEEALYVEMMRKVPPFTGDLSGKIDRGLPQF